MNGLKIQWGSKSRGTIIKSSSGYVDITANDGFLAYSGDYIPIVSYISSTSGLELVVQNKQPSSFRIYGWNRNSSDSVPSPNFTWITIGY